MKQNIISVAPMMGWTDRHARYFLRLLSKHVLLYTEMVTTGALLQGDRDYHLRYHDNEHPLALQLGGSEPAALAACARIAEDYGYDEINLNVGCPSDRVQSGSFGACLMLEPDLVAECVAAMNQVVSIPVTVKCRTGVDKQEDYESLAQFIETVSQTGCSSFIVHARNAWLKGLSPKQNREIPPLKYDYVYQIKRDFPTFFIAINGGIKDLDVAARHLQFIDSVMIGREAYQRPYLLADIDRKFYGINEPPVRREQVVEQMVAYIQEQQMQGQNLHSITRHMLGLFSGCAGAKSWRRMISENDHLDNADASLLQKAASLIV